MPSPARTCVGSRVISRPCKVMCPDRTGSNPMMLSMVVVLPAPLRPTRHTTSRSCTTSESPCKMWAGPRKVCTCTSSSIRQAPSATTPSGSLCRRCAQQRGCHGRVSTDVSRGAIGENSALVHHDNTIRVGKDHVHIMFDNHGGDVPRSDYGGNRIHDATLVAGAHPTRG